MTASIPVYNNMSSVYGVAAFDISMTTIFSEVVNFYIGVHSYSFMFETRHGKYYLLFILVFSYCPRLKAKGQYNTPRPNNWADMKIPDLK